MTMKKRMKGDGEREGRILAQKEGVSEGHAVTRCSFSWIVLRK